jgi:hypothetical protein
MARTPQIAHANNRPEVGNRDDSQATRRTFANVRSNLDWLSGRPSILVDNDAEIWLSRSDHCIGDYRLLCIHLTQLTKMR